MIGKKKKKPDDEDDGLSDLEPSGEKVEGNYSLIEKIVSTIFFFSNNKYYLMTLAGVKCCVVVHKSLYVHHHSVDYIFWFFGINELISGCSEYTIPLKYLPGGMSSVAVTMTAHE